MKRIFNLQNPLYNNKINKNKQPLRRLLSSQPSFADESLYKEDIMILPAISLLPTQQDLGPSKQLVRTKSSASFSTITTAEGTPSEFCGIKKTPARQSLSVLANALVPLEISFPNKPLPPTMPRQLMEKAHLILELEEDYFEDGDDDDDDDDDDQVEKTLPPMRRQLMEKARPIPEPEEDYFEEDDDDDDKVEIVFLPDAEIVFLPDDHIPPPPARPITTVPPPLYTHSRKMESDPQPEEPCRDRPALRRGPSVGLQDLRVPARSFEPVRTLPSCVEQALQEQRDLRVPARLFEPGLFGVTRFEI
jgi:hypothetical protein